MKATFVLLCLFAVISQGWGMDGDEMSQLMVGTWQANGQQQMPSGIARYTVNCTYTEDGQFDGSWAWVFPPTSGQATSAFVRVSGTWKIESGNLSTHFEQVDPPYCASLFSDSSNAVEFIDRNTWKFVDGSVGVAHRLK